MRRVFLNLSILNYGTHSYEQRYRDWKYCIQSKICNPNEMQSLPQNSHHSMKDSICRTYIDLHRRTYIGVGLVVAGLSQSQFMSLPLAASCVMPKRQFYCPWTWERKESILKDDIVILGFMSALSRCTLGVSYVLCVYAVADRQTYKNICTTAHACPRKCPLTLKGFHKIHGLRAGLGWARSKTKALRHVGFGGYVCGHASARVCLSTCWCDGARDTSHTKRETTSSLWRYRSRSC